MTADEEIARGERARQLLGDPLLKESFDNCAEALLMAVKSAKTEAEAYKAAIAMQVFDLIKRQLEQHVETGKLAQFNFKPEKRFGLF